MASLIAMLQALKLGVGWGMTDRRLRLGGQALR